MKKQIMSLLLAVVMCVGLAVSAFAAPVPAFETEAAEAPQYAVHQVCFQPYIGCYTTANVFFSVAEKGGNYYFESLDSVSFSTTNPRGLHWRLDSYGYRLGDTVCDLTLERSEMEGSVYTGYSDKAILSITIDVVMSDARGGDPVMLTPEVSIGSVAETANQSAVCEIGGKQVTIIPLSAD